MLKTLHSVESFLHRLPLGLASYDNLLKIHLLQLRAWPLLHVLERNGGVHPNLATLAVFGRGHGSLFTQNRLLGSQAEDPQRFSSGSSYESRWKPPTVQIVDPLESRKSLRKQCLATLLQEHHLEPSMSRRGNCRDSAAESFFRSLKNGNALRSASTPIESCS